MEIAQYDLSGKHDSMQVKEDLLDRPGSARSEVHDATHRVPANNSTNYSLINHVHSTPLNTFTPLPMPSKLLINKSCS